MKKNNKKTINYKKERVVLSDILPYEVPPFFSNRYFYQFLSDNKITFNNDELRFRKDSSNKLGLIIKIIFGIDYERVVNKNNLDYDYIKMSVRGGDFVSIPFKFKIKHTETEFRELSVIHPRNQLRMLYFYDKYKHSIVRGCDGSKFSIRKPIKIATIKYYKDRTNANRKSTNSDNEIIETIQNEYTSLKSYFSYSKYNNIYKFYESHDYHKAEKRFDKLLKFDISRCFPSIYTHSITWALLSKRCIKDNLKHKDDFWGGEFDRIMQELNYNETNGIVIGPEFSRVFAEIILQKVDKEVEMEISDKFHFVYKTDYDIYRYVDDYFLFYSKDDVKTEILKIYKSKLQEYNLHFNDSKTIEYSKPLITNISIAKEDIKHLVERTSFLMIKDSRDKESGVLYYKTKDVITNYKAILSKTQTSYKDLQNYFLATIFNRVQDSIKYFNKEYKSLIKLYTKRKKTTQTLPEYEELLFEISEKEKLLYKLSKNLYSNFKDTIELAFFVYTVHPRVTYSIKLCSILYQIIDFIKNTEKTTQRRRSHIIEDEKEEFFCIDFDDKHHLFKLIFDNTCFVFRKEKANGYSQVETLYLLLLLRELGTNYKVNAELIESHFAVPDSKLVSTSEVYMNYFTILSLLNYIRRDSYYNGIRDVLQLLIRNKFDNFDQSKAEDIFLLIDILTCPYIANSDNDVKTFRIKLLKKINFFSRNTPNRDYESFVSDINIYFKDMFYMWSNNNIGRDLNTKRGHEVY